MSVNVKDYTGFCVPSKVHCWYCLLFYALCQTGPVHGKITDLIYATGFRDNATCDEVIFPWLIVTVHCWYILFFQWMRHTRAYHRLLSLLGCTLHGMFIFKVCSHTMQCSIYKTECHHFYVIWIEIAHNRSYLIDYHYFLNPTIGTGITPKVKWNSSEQRCDIDIYPKQGLLSHIWYAKKCKHIWDFACALDIVMLYEGHHNPSRLCFHMWSLKEWYWNQHALRTGAYFTFFSAWWMCSLRRSDKSHYLMINHPLYRIHLVVLINKIH